MEDKRIVEGIGFIKTRKPESTIEKIADIIKSKAKEYRVENPKIYIDDGCHTDIDRPEIDALFRYLSCGDFEVLFIRRAMDITLEIADLKKFIRDVNKLGVQIVCLAEETSQYSEEKNSVDCITFYNAGSGNAD